MTTEDLSRLKTLIDPLKVLCTDLRWALAQTDAKTQETVLEHVQITMSWLQQVYTDLQSLLPKQEEPPAKK